MSRNKKTKKQLQAQVEQQTVAQLKSEIKLLKRLPKDFRDMSPGSPDWEKFADITNRRKEMEKWSAGPVLCLRKLNYHESMVLTNVKIAPHSKKFTDIWYSILEHTEWAKCSWIYLPDEEPEVINALNVLLSRFEYNCRVRGQIMSERTGKTIGVVH